MQILQVGIFSDEVKDVSPADYKQKGDPLYYYILEKIN